MINRKKARLCFHLFGILLILSFSLVNFLPFLFSTTAIAQETEKIKPAIDSGFEYEAIKEEFTAQFGKDKKNYPKVKFSVKGKGVELTLVPSTKEGLTQPSPTPSLSPTPSSTPSASPSPEPTLTPTPSPEPNPTLMPMITPSPSISPSATPSPVPTSSPTPSPTPSPSPTPTLTPSPPASPSATPSPTPIPEPAGFRLFNFWQALAAEEETIIGPEIKLKADEEKGEVLIEKIEPQVDIKYKITDKGIKEEIILQNPQSILEKAVEKVKELFNKESSPQQPQEISNTFVFNLNLEGLTYKKRLDGLWYFYDENETSDANPLFYIPKPFMVDAKGERSEAVKIHHIIENGQEFFQLEADAGWLTDPARAYPVTIDPSFELPQGSTEIIEKRNASSKTWRKPDGVFVWEGSIGAIHYQDGSGNWQEIDTTLVPSSQSIPGFGDVAYEMVENEYELFVRKKIAGVAPLVRYVSKNTDYYVDFTADDLDWVNDIGDREHIKAPGNPDTVVSGGEARWPDVYGPGIDLRFVAGFGRMQKWLDIASPLPAPTISNPSLEFSEILRYHDDLDVYIDGLLWDKNTEVSTASEIEFRSPDGEVQFVFPVAVGYHEGEGEPVQGQIRLKKSGNKLYVTVRFPYAWLQAATYPIHLDTTVDKQTAASGDDGRRYSGSEGFNASEAVVWPGYQDYDGYYHQHMFARWTGVTIAGTINVSYVQCYADSGTYGTPYLKVYGVDEDNPAAPTSAAEFDADPLTTAAVDWDGTWANGAWNNSPSLNTIFQELVDTYTISNKAVMVQVKNDGGTTNAWHYCRQWDYSGNLHGPKLHIEYTPPNSAPTASTISETSTSASPTNVGSTVTFSGTISDPDASDQVRLAICKTDAIGASSTCTGGAWCYDPSSTTWQAEGAASCSYTTLAGDASSNAWYAYACDDDNACTNMTESDGTFYVNHEPVTGAASSDADSAPGKNVGQDITFTMPFTDSDSDNAKIHVCKTDAISGETCSGGSWCDGAAYGTSPQTCAHTAAVGDGTSNSYYVFACDEHSLCDSSSVSGTFYVNHLPTGSFNSASQKTNGTGKVDISIEVDDGDDDDTKAKLEYVANGACDFTTPLDPTLDEAGGATADFNDSGGVPSVVNTDTYQVGTTATYRIITSSGSNTVQFDWNSATDAPTADGTYCLRLTVNDDSADQTTPATQTLTLDNC